MPTHVLMPALSPEMKSGKLAKWLKREGDRVVAGDILAEIETDKATMEVEAVESGVLARILVPEGAENVAVDSAIALIEAAVFAPYAEEPGEQEVHHEIHNVFVHTITVREA